MLRKESSHIGSFFFKYRGLFPLLVLPAEVLVIYQNLAILPIPSSPTAWLLMALTGLLVRGYTVGYSPKGTSGRNTGRQLAQHLNQTGAYSVVRHPLYLGNFLIWTAVASCSGSGLFVGCFLLAFFLFYRKIIETEEIFLQHQYGDTYLQWKEKTPLFLPNFSLYKSSVLPFNWKKVVRKEKNGIAALFGVFCLLDITRNLKNSHTLLEAVILSRGWIIAAFAAIAYYIAVKILSTYTRWVS